MRLREGEIFAGYRVLRQLGRGGMAYVYLAEEAGSDQQVGALRQVALKLLPEDVADDAEAVLRFTQEAQTIAALEHPNIVPLYRHGIERGVPWMALRLVRGGDLAERLQRPLAVAEGLQIFRQIAQALDFAHRMNVIHRDLKPQNVLLSRDEGGETHAYLADFGIAKLLAGSARVRTGTGGILGTPQYMSPEAARGEALGPAADIYALGVMIFQWQTSCLPFDADTPLAVLYKQVQEPLPEAPLRDLPAEVARVLRVALDKDARARPASAVALVDQLATALGANTATAVTAPSRVRVEPAAGYPESLGAPASAPTVWAEPAEGWDPIRKAASPQRPMASTSASTAARLNGWFWAAGLGLTGIMALAWWAGSQSVPELPTEALQPVTRLAESAVPAGQAPISAPSTAPPGTKATPTEVVRPDSPPVTPAVIESELRVEVSPAGASVRLDGALVGTGSMTLKVASGKAVKIRAELDGHEPQEERVLVPGGKAIAVVLNLKPKSASTPVSTIVAASEDISYNRARPPRYPPDALRNGIQGTVMVHVQVGSDGSVLEAKIHEAVHPSLDRAALQAVANWKFNPASKGGVPYADWVLVPVRFSLGN